MSERDKLNKTTINSSSSSSSKLYQQQQQVIYDTSFDYTLPRPPALGEERTHCTSESEWTLSPPQQQQQQMDKYKYRLPRSNNVVDDDNNVSASTSPACLRWAHSLHNLLQDQDGVNLFLQYLESEGQQHANILHFWFACEGLRKHNEIEKIKRLVKLMYKTYFMKLALPINDELRMEITKNMKSTQCLDPPVTLFDEAQAQIEYLINNTTYPNFLKSDMYLQYLQSVQNPSSRGSEDLCSESSSSSGGGGCSSLNNKELATNLTATTGAIGPLPTLHEDMELIMNPSGGLMLTPGTGSVSTGYHTPNVSGPVRLTKDMLLMSQKHRALDIRPKSETYAGDGRSAGRSSRHKTSLEAKHARELAALNKETDIHQTFIPRTQRVEVNKCVPMDLRQHAAILKEKLENVKRERDTQELFDKKLKESSNGSMNSLDENKLRASTVQSRELENAIREKLQLEDDNDQDILDEHVSRVFSDLTSPSMVSPRPLSPQRNRYVQAYVRPRRKDKDGFSTFSGDSGNVHDFADGSEHKMSMVKSKSMPEYGDERFSRGSIYRRSSSKKTLTDLTDSGVSVVSDTPPVLIPGKESRVLTWLMESDKSGRIPSHTHSEISMKHRSSVTSPNAIGKQYRKSGYTGSRSNSLERTGGGSVTGGVSGNSGLAPAQPFVADPNMPPPPLPNIASQLDEARRRLEDDIRIRSRQKPNKYYTELSQSGLSTLRKSTRGQKNVLPPMQSMDDSTITATVVVFSFCDEQFPYRTKIPGTQVTLRQFKEYLPKKGNYRFFFKTVCEDLDNQVTHEEVSNDSEVLPLWEGKIMAQVKPID